MNLKKYPSLLATLAMLALVITLFSLHAIAPAHAVALVILWQLALHALSPRRAALFVPGISASQAKEFENLIEEVGEDWESIKGLVEENRLRKKEIDELRGDVTKYKKLAFRGGDNGIRLIGEKPMVSDACALAFAGLYVISAARQNKWTKHLGDQDSALQSACDSLGVTKAALASTDIPLPTLYIPQVVELVYKYGQFRQFATVFPLGAGTVNLPQLKVGEDAFVFLGAGTAGMSQAVPERKVAAQNVTFTANKCGGIIRIPSEIEEDTFIPLGQFLARYVSRRFANLEDQTGFLGDGTATYAGIKGVGPYIVAQPGTPQLRQLAAGKTKPTDAQLSDFRALRSNVNAAVLQMGTAAYYCHPTMEALFVTFNTIGSPLIYRPQNGAQPATLDGFPIRWVGVMQPYSTLAAANAFLAFFGDLSYWYLGERGAPRVESSREVYFATDEVGMRALERIDVEAMAPDAMAALQTAPQ